MKKCVFNITGMTCAACQAHISEKVNKLDGIESAEVNLIAERMIAVYDENRIKPDDIIAAVESVGYGASLSLL